ncbi:hypothetical protein M011DRAFT_483845 [Sporormia fimetaria CBS 119925]|uniref:Uncharacterized protein n=1 Tax=Sporormia fimetaria CBS 119925 TaxID=1340428 RepID=A0A6A6VK03_9PLEO|nr:hypothetical protein M011DRAFT_483845 [Sporormia fimetaria CBS 119925]
MARPLEDAYVKDVLRKQDAVGQALYAKLLEKCPRETRDEVYSYLIPAEFIGVYTEVRRIHEWDNTKLDHQMASCLTKDRLGATVAREVAMWCYRHLAFRFEDLTRERRHIVTNWLQGTDCHGLVRGEHVRHIELAVKLGYDPLLDPDYDYYTMDPVRVMPSLSAIPQDANITVLIYQEASLFDWEEYDEDEDDDEDLAEAAFGWINSQKRAVSTLLEKGHPVTLGVTCIRPCRFAACWKETLVSIKQFPINSRITSRKFFKCKDRVVRTVGRGQYAKRGPYLKQSLFFSGQF